MVPSCTKQRALSILSWLTLIAAKVLKLFAQRGSSSKAVDFQLSERELEILKLLAEGYSYKTSPHAATSAAPPGRCT
jgi:DNA-binding NarL/FixJ family response regulator